MTEHARSGGLGSHAKFEPPPVAKPVAAPVPSTTPDHLGAVVEALDRIANSAERANAALQKLGATPVKVVKHGETEVTTIGTQDMPKITEAMLAAGAKQLEGLCGDDIAEDVAAHVFKAMWDAQRG